MIDVQQILKAIEGYVRGWIQEMGPLFSNQWEHAMETWTYASPTTFTTPGDRTEKYGVGTKLRYKQGGSFKYAYVVARAYTSVTTVTITGGSDYSLVNAPITDNYLSYLATPQGFPGNFNWTPTVTATSGTFTSISCSGKFSFLGGVMHATWTITITTNGTAAGAIVVLLPTAAAGAAVGDGRENTVTGNLLQVFINSGNTYGVVLTYHNQYPGGDGRTLYLSATIPLG